MTNITSTKSNRPEHSTVGTTQYGAGGKDSTAGNCEQEQACKEIPSAEAFDELASVFAAYNDITERMNLSHRQLQSEVLQLRLELQQKNEQLERKSRLAALGEMAAGMAHEIRNPLGGVQLYASLLERDLAGRDDQLKWVHKITKGVHSLDRIVSDILAFTNEQRCHKTAVSLVELFGDIMDYVAPRVDGTSVQVDISRVKPNLKVDVDIKMMQRVLLNLVFNAIEAVGEEGEIIIGGDVFSHEPPYSVRIWVADTGPGINPEVLNKIFNPFFTTKDTGTGLGLAIVHRIIECHGGLILATNNEQGGATFTILLS